MLQALDIWREARGQEQIVDPVEDDISGTGVYIDLDTEVKSYGQKIDALYAHLPVAGFVTQLKVPIDIEEIYVPMRAMLNMGG